MTFEASIGAEMSKTPPGWICVWPIRLESFMGRGRRCRLTTFRFSTITRRRFGSASMMRPCLPRSLPDSTWTTSPFRTFIACAMSEHLRGERDDLHEVALAQLAGHGPEDACPARVVADVDDHGGVLVEADVRAVVAAEGLLRAHDDRADDLALLDRALRRGGLHRGGDDVADAGVAAL